MVHLRSPRPFASTSGQSLWSTEAWYTLNSIPGSPPPPTGGTITGVGGKCLDVDNSGTADGTKIQLYTCNGTAAQSWTKVGDTYRVLGKCLDIDNAGTANGTKSSSGPATAPARRSGSRRPTGRSATRSPARSWRPQAVAAPTAPRSSSARTRAAHTRSGWSAAG